MSTVVIRTFAYNAEKTVERTIQSVLAQTHHDFIWYLLDNGSTDKTSEIINRYAKQDYRIIPLKSDVNQYDTRYSIGLFYDILNRHDDNCFFCTLDSDDEYCPDFFKEMLAFMSGYHLQVAACASDFIHQSTNKIVGTRKLDTKLILEGIAFEKYFPCYHQFMRTIWGKLYSFALLRQCRFERIYEVSYGNDTLFAMEAFRRAHRAGILDKPLHRYYMHSKSVSYTAFDEKRLVSDQILHELGIEFLEEYGEISASNMEFLNLVYFSGIRDTCRVIFHAQVSSTEKLQAVHRVLSSPFAYNLFRVIAEKEVDPFRKTFFQWLFSSREFHQGKNANTAIEILEVIDPDFPYSLSKGIVVYLWIKVPEMASYLVQRHYANALERLHTWYKRHENDDPMLVSFELVLFERLNKTKWEFFSLLMEIKEKRPKSSVELDVDQRIKNILQNEPLLQNISVELSQKLKRVIIFALKGDLTSACECFQNMSETVEIADSEMEAYLILGQNLFAAAEEHIHFLYYKKLTIAYFLQQSCYERAEEQLADFDFLLPQDENFAEFREILHRWRHGE